MTTSASLIASAAESRVVTSPRRPPARPSAANRSARSGSRSWMTTRAPGSTTPSIARWLSPWTPAPTSATDNGLSPGVGAQRVTATPETAAVRRAVMPAASSTARSSPVRASLSSSVAPMAGWPVSRFPGNPVTHLMPRRSSAPSAPGPRNQAGMACPNDASGRGWTSIFAGRSASWTNARSVRSASRSCSGSEGIDAATSRTRGNGRAGRWSSPQGNAGVRRCTHLVGRCPRAIGRRRATGGRRATGSRETAPMPFDAPMPVIDRIRTTRDRSGDWYSPIRPSAARPATISRPSACAGGCHGTRGPTDVAAARRVARGERSAPRQGVRTGVVSLQVGRGIAGAIGTR